MFDYKDLYKIYVPEQFGPTDEGDISNGIDEVFAQLPGDEVKTDWGATQFVIMIPGADKVAKIPFNGEEFYDYETVTDEDGYEEEIEEYGFDYFRTDYCKRAYELYCDAEERGLNSILAEMEYFGKTANGVDIYLQETVELYDYCEGSSKYFKSEDAHTNSKNELEQLRRRSQSIGNGSLWYRFPTEWMVAALHHYGECFMLSFLLWCRDNNLCDFHDGNLGWSKKDGSPVILDWAGYYE